MQVFGDRRATMKGKECAGKGEGEVSSGVVRKDENAGARGK